jgi:hypothetical protein
VLAINRTLGLGFEAPLTPAVLEWVVRTYATANARRFVVQWSPAAQPSNAADMFARRGFKLVSRIVKMIRPAQAPQDEPRGPSPLSIREVGPEYAAVFEGIVARPLGVPEGLDAGVRSTMGHRRWHYYLAYDGHRPIAGAVLYVRGQHAWCGLGATREADRGRGAQLALLRRRIADAAAAGCHWISADTLAGSLPTPAQSRRNLERAGFTTLYERPNYLFDVTDAGVTSRSA